MSEETRDEQARRAEETVLDQRRCCLDMVIEVPWMHSYDMKTYR
jgi:hypothetical protein